MQYQPPFDPALAGVRQPNGTFNADADAAYGNGNASTAIEGSIPPDDAFEHPQREMVAAIVSSGLVPSHSVLDQLAEGIARLVSRAVFGTSGGTANAITLAKIGDTVVPKALVAPMEVVFLPAATNTGATTLAAFGLAATAVVDEGGAALTGGELVIGRLTAMRYETTSGGRFRIYPWANAKTSSVPRRRQPYFTPGTYTFTVPAGVDLLDVDLWSGGGAGGASANGSGGSIAGNAGAGGGSGANARKRIAVTPGDAITVTVGAGGAPSSTSGGNGGSSSFGAHVSATGGAGGTWGSNTSQAGGAGGVATGGDVNIDGSRGGTSGHNTASAASQSNILHIMARGGIAPGGLSVMDFYGTGGDGRGVGTGGTGASGGSSLLGGAGAPGGVVVTW